MVKIFLLLLGPHPAVAKQWLSNRIPLIALWAFLFLWSKGVGHEERRTPAINDKIRFIQQRLLAILSRASAFRVSSIVIFEW